MKKDCPRVAFFPDTFHQTDGVSVFAGHFEAFARRQQIPFLTVHAGPRDETSIDGSTTRVQLRRGFGTFPLDRAHKFDLFFLRHYERAAALIQRFQPDIVQITGPGDAGILGAMLARKFNLPLAAFWQTDLPQYAGLRSSQALSFLPRSLNRHISGAARLLSSRAVARFYRMPSLTFAPNPEIVEELESTTGRPCLKLGHGVDADAFYPELRDRHTGPFTIGYVGRLSAEKNVRNLAALEKSLSALGTRRFKLVIVGHGGEEQWLRDNLHHAEFRGVLKGRELARAFANMDVLAFPSNTDTFGLVVLEALASGVPAVVTDHGGPKYIVRHGETGYVTRSFEEFANAVAGLMTHPERLACMRTAARRYAVQRSWKHAFQEIYNAYHEKWGAYPDRDFRTPDAVSA